MARLSLVVVAFALVSALAGGCGGAEDGGTANGAGGAPTRVSASEFAFDRNEVTVEGGRVTIELVNEGSSSHALAIEGNGVEEATDVVGTGETTSLEAELGEGTYEIYCPVGDHRERGMEGTLTVEGGAAPDDDDDEDDDDGGGLRY